MFDKKEWNRQYFHYYKEECNIRRRNRYHYDPEYRESIKRYAREQYNRYPERKYIRQIKYRFRKKIFNMFKDKKKHGLLR